MIQDFDCKPIAVADAWSREAVAGLVETDADLADDQLDSLQYVETCLEAAAEAACHSYFDNTAILVLEMDVAVRVATEAKVDRLSLHFEMTIG